MNLLEKTIVAASMLLAIAPIASASQFRDATSKARGAYGNATTTQRTTLPEFVPPAPVIAPSEQAAVNRTFTYDPLSNANPRNAVSQENKLSVANRPALPQQRTRQFSYLPDAAMPRAVYRPMRTWQSNVRDAGSKALGQY